MALATLHAFCTVLSTPRFPHQAAAVQLRLLEQLQGDLESERAAAAKATADREAASKGLKDRVLELEVRESVMGRT